MALSKKTGEIGKPWKTGLRGEISFPITAPLLWTLVSSRAHTRPPTHSVPHTPCTHPNTHTHPSCHTPQTHGTCTPPHYTHTTHHTHNTTAHTPHTTPGTHPHGASLSPRSPPLPEVSWLWQEAGVSVQSRVIFCPGAMREDAVSLAVPHKPHRPTPP